MGGKLLYMSCPCGTWRRIKLNISRDLTTIITVWDDNSCSIVHSTLPVSEQKRPRKTICYCLNVKSDWTRLMWGTGTTRCIAVYQTLFHRCKRMANRDYYIRGTCPVTQINVMPKYSISSMTKPHNNLHLLVSTRSARLLLSGAGTASRSRARR